MTSAAGIVRRSTRARPTDDELLDAARSVFAEQGFTRTTMSAVAERSNSTKPTLYAHFGDKDALYAALLVRESDACRRTLFEAYERNADLELHEQVTADTEAFFGYAGNHPEAFVLLFGDHLKAAGVREQLVSDVNDQIVARLHHYLVRHGLRTAGSIPSRDEHQLAALLVGVAVTSARHAMATGATLDRACQVAAAFSAAALANIVL